MKNAGKIIAFLIIIALILVPLTACEEEAEVTKITVEAGTTGSQGEQGVGGAPGRAGEQGEQGEQGPAGEAGATWYTGSGVPTAATGANDDLYLNTANGDVYKKVSGAWTKIANLKGPQGDKGDKGDEGAGGAMGTAGQNAQIVVTDGSGGESPGYYAYCYFNLGTDYENDPQYLSATIFILGSGFEPDTYLEIGLYNDNGYWELFTPTTDDNGAFSIAALITKSMGTGNINLLSTVAAYDYYSAELLATWPLIIYYTYIPPPP